MATLTVRDGPLAGRSVEVVAEVIAGRADCLLALDDPATSRRHARFIAAEDGGVEVTDLGSRNGTFVNGRRLDGSARLRDGDVVLLGQTSIVVSGAGSRGADLGATSRVVSSPPPAGLEPGSTARGSVPPAVPGAPARPAAAFRPQPPSPAAAPPPPPPQPRLGSGAPPVPAPTAPGPPGPLAPLARPPGTPDYVPPQLAAPFSATAGRRPAAASRLAGPTIVTYAVIVATAIALIVYFILRPQGKA